MRRKKPEYLQSIKSQVTLYPEVSHYLSHSSSVSLLKKNIERLFIQEVSGVLGLDKLTVKSLKHDAKALLRACRWAVSLTQLEILGQTAEGDIALLMKWKHTAPIFVAISGGPDYRNALAQCLYDYEFPHNPSSYLLPIMGNSVFNNFVYFGKAKCKFINNFLGASLSLLPRSKPEGEIHENI